MSYTGLDSPLIVNWTEYDNLSFDDVIRLARDRGISVYIPTGTVLRPEEQEGWRLYIIRQLNMQDLWEGGEYEY